MQVWLATCKPLGEQVGLKILELDNMAVDLVSILWNPLQDLLSEQFATFACPAICSDAQASSS